MLGPREIRGSTYPGKPPAWYTKALLQPFTSLVFLIWRWLCSSHQTAACEDSYAQIKAACGLEIIWLNHILQIRCSYKEKPCHGSEKQYLVTLCVPTKTYLNQSWFILPRTHSSVPCMHDIKSDNPPGNKQQCETTQSIEGKKIAKHTTCGLKYIPA